VKYFVPDKNRGATSTLYTHRFKREAVAANRDEPVPGNRRKPKPNLSRRHGEEWKRGRFR